MTDVDLLSDLLDTLLPGDGADWPAAGAHGLADRTRELSRDLPGATDAIAAVLKRLPGDFRSLSPEAREQAVRTIEAAEPAAFDLVINAAYSSYYTDSGVRDVIARLTGYENRPPQPLGYALAPFDEDLLKITAARPPFWRKVQN